MESGAVIWLKGLNDAAGGDQELYYDSSYIYHRGRVGLSCYNSINGTTVWHFSWVAYSDANYSNTIAFNDSLIFFSDQTSAWAPSNLYCLNKRTGQLRWKKQIDAAGWASYHFYAIQAVAAGKLVTLARNSNGQKKLVCLDISNGQQLWETPINDLLKPTIKIFDEKVYANGATAFCYSLNSGVLLWQNNFGVNSSSAYFGCSSTADQNKIYSVVASATSSTMHSIQTVDLTTGLSTASFNTLASPYIVANRYQFAKNIIYALSPNSPFDSTELQAYDMITNSLKWKYKNYASTVIPIVSDKYIIFRDYVEPQPNDNPLYLTVLTLDAKRIRRIKVPGKYPAGIIYLDENNKVFNLTTY